MSAKADQKTSLTVIGGGKSSLVSESDYQRMTDEQAALVMRTYFPDLNKDEVSLFLDYSAIYKADPRKKESWATIRWSKKKGNDGRDKLDERGNPIFERRVVMGLSKHQVQKRLEERPDFAGIESAVVYEKDGFEADLGAGQISHKIKSINIKDRGMMVAAWCRISRHGKTPYIRILYASERQDDRNFNWNKMGPTMLLKCVEMDSVRGCYPKEFAGVLDEAEADTFGETIPADRMQETTATVKESAGAEAVKAFAADLPTVDAAPEEAPIDTDTPATNGANINAEQMNALKAVMQEFKIIPLHMRTILEKELNRKPKSLADIRKPEFQKIVKAFDGVRDGRYTLSGGKILRPEDVDALNKQADDEGVPFGK